MLIDRNGDQHEIIAYEIEQICGKIGQVKVGHLVHSFPSLKKEDVAKCGGEIELLIGMGHAALHQVRTAAHEGLCLYGSQFGTGKILGGTHQLIEGESPEFSAAVSCHTQAQARNVYVSQKCVNCGIDCGIDFLTAEEFGVSVPPRCPKCTACKDCSHETKQLSRVKKKELEVIRGNLKLNPVKKKWKTKYPYQIDPEELKENYKQAYELLVRTEKRLTRGRKRDQENYCAQFQDFIDREVISEISEEEQRKWKGPVFYLTHHEVLKEDCASTPCRLVVNSSLQYKGLSLNDTMMKGPNSLRDLHGIQLKFRIHRVALVCDIKKMYHSILTTELDKHIRRILWRGMDATQKSKIYGFNTVTFGEKPAAAIAAVAIQEAARTFSHINPAAAQRIEEDIYVDDMATGAATFEEVDKLEKAIKEILDNGGFNVHGFVRSGDTATEILALLGSGEISRVLGMNWYPPTDELTITVNINISKKKRGAKNEPDLRFEEIPRILEIRFTKRLILRIVYSIYDPLGLVCVITVQLKLQLRKLYKKDCKIGWDDALPRDIVERWVELLQLLKKVEAIRFKRCIKPRLEAIGNPDLVIFNDGSSEAMCVIAYIKMANGSRQAQECSVDSKDSCRTTP